MPQSLHSYPLCLFLMLILAAGGCASGNKPQTHPQYSGKDLIDTPIPDGLDERFVKPHQGEAMARAKRPLAEIVAQQTKPEFLVKAEAHRAAGTEYEPPALSHAAMRAYVAARLALHENQAYSAITNLNNVNRLVPDHPQVLRLLGQVYRQAGNRARAVEFLEQAVQLDGGDRLSVFELGKMAMEQGDYLRAVALFDGSLKMEDEASDEVNVVPLIHFYLAATLAELRFDLAAGEQLEAYIADHDADFGRGTRLSHEARLLSRQIGNSWQLLGDIRSRLAKAGQALHAYETAAKLGVSDAENLMRRLVYLNLRLNRKQQAVDIITVQIRSNQIDGATLPLLSYLAKHAQGQTQQLADQLQVYYDNNHRPTEILLALSQLRGKEEGETLLRTHLQQSPADLRVFNRLLEIQLGDDPARRTAQQHADAIELVHFICKDNRSLIATYLGELFESTDAQALVSGFDALTEELRHDPLILLFEARSLRAVDRDDDAQQVLRKALEAAPDLAPARSDLAALLFENEEYDQTIAIVEPFVEQLDPGIVNIYAKALQKVDRHADALNWLDKAIAQNPSDAELYVAKGQLLIEMNDWLETERFLHAALRRLPREEKIYLALIELYDSAGTLIEGGFEKYSALIRRMYSMLPNSNHARRLRAQLALQEGDGDFQLAGRLVRENLDDDPRDFQSIALMVAMLRGGGEQRVQMFINDRMAAFPDDPDALYNLAAICSSYGFEEMSQNILIQIIEKHPQHPSANNDLGYTWADKGIKLDEALRMIQVAVNAEPNQASYIDSLGWVYYKLGRFDDAVRELTRAAEMYPDPVVIDHLGDALYRLGRKEEAVAQWELAREKLAEMAPFSVPTYTRLNANVTAKLQSMRLQRNPNVAPVGEQPQQGANNDQQQPIRHVVRAGETLSTIAEQHYGDARKWRLIAEVNPKLDFGHLRVGDVLVIPQP